MKWFFLLFAASSAAVSLLSLVHAPAWRWTWKLAVVVGEYGHWLVMFSLGLAVIAGIYLCGISCASCSAKTGMATRASPTNSVGPALVAVPKTSPVAGTRTHAPIAMCVEGAWWISILLLCGMATVGFLRPVFSARRIATRLPSEMQAALGGVAPARSGFEFGRLYFGSGSAEVKVTTELFAKVEGVELKLDFYAPPLSKNTAQRPPCLIVIHGGGWDSGDRTQLAEWNHHWATQGYAVAALSYRLAPRWIWPAQRDDVLAAIAWLKAHADNLGIDPARLILLGRSAGGQIATAVGYGANDPAIRGVISLYSPHDMPFAWSVSRVDDTLNSIQLLRQLFGGAPEEGNQASYASASGQLLVHAGSPATLLIHGTNDTLSWYRHSERLTARLEELRVPHYYLRLPWATHGFDFNRNGPGGQLTDEAIEAFIGRVAR